ncbi:FAD-dependent thymidylate synthase [Lacrimispora sp.]|uniref:FAD-dependent thymidylate synthase n=1 Tax=Lacrimispora sp. TaxID=2719234 RepID=UPI002FDAF64F
MRRIKPTFFIETNVNNEQILEQIERAGRVCYKSESKITKGSSEQFVKNILKSGHESVIEHCSLSVRIICDRGVTHEIVRHRIASYSQESTRYCNYASNKFNNELTFIEPCFWKKENDIDKLNIWIQTMEYIEKQYLKLMELGATAQEARSILPNSLKTEIVVTMNLREWRHFFRLRAASGAHPQMQEVAFMILEKFKEELPVFFNDI